eukprot:2251977-Amphidinium_carterae.1
MKIDGIMRDVIIEGSKPGYFNKITRSLDRCVDVRITQEARFAVHAQGAWKRPSRAKEDETVLVHVPETAMRGILRAQADADWAGCQSTCRSTSCGMTWWGGFLISSYARTCLLHNQQ